MNLYVLFILVIIFLMLLSFIKKEGYSTATLDDTVSTCNDGSKKYIYKNNGLTHWYNETEIQDILKNINNLDFNDNSCTKTLPLKTFHPKKTYFDYDYSNLSNDNIRLMNPCEFYNGKNPITNNTCIETFINNMENEYINNQENEKKLSLDDKIYLTICSAFFVYLLFQVSNRYNM